MGEDYRVSNFPQRTLTFLFFMYMCVLASYDGLLARSNLCGLISMRSRFSDESELLGGLLVGWMKSTKLSPLLVCLDL